MTPGSGLVERIEARLGRRSAAQDLRQQPMFGGVAFMLDGRMLVHAGGDGDLLVRADPDRAPELLGLDGARPAEMGAGRAMGPGWISVGSGALDDDGLDLWLEVALDHHRGRRP